MHSQSGNESKTQKGALVQLVRMPACHAGGHGFESRTHRERVEVLASTLFIYRAKKNFGLYDKKRPEISCTPFIYYSFGQKLFDDKKSAFVAALIAPLKRVRRMVISVGFVKTVNAIL